MPPPCLDLPLRCSYILACRSYHIFNTALYLIIVTAIIINYSCMKFAYAYKYYAFGTIVTMHLLLQCIYGWSIKANYF